VENYDKNNNNGRKSFDPHVMIRSKVKQKLKLKSGRQEVQVKKTH
jgi:hypothetical protein